MNKLEFKNEAELKLFSFYETYGGTKFDNIQNLTYIVPAEFKRDILREVTLQDFDFLIDTKNLEFRFRGIKIKWLEHGQSEEIELLINLLPN